MIASDDEFELCVDGLQHSERFCEGCDAADLGEIAEV